MQLTTLCLKISLMRYIFLAMWLTGFILCNLHDCGSIWIILSLFLVIFRNLGTREKGELSAYSVFNEGCQRLLGTMTSEQFEREIRHDDGYGEGIDDITGPDNMQRARGQIREHNAVGVVASGARKKGKKSRRGYEQRLLRRALQHSESEGGVEFAGEEWELDMDFDRED